MVWAELDQRENDHDEYNDTRKSLPIGDNDARRATVKTCFWIIAACLFGAVLGIMRGDGKVVAEYLTGYLLELSLSIDNLCVFILIFKHFHVPPEGQERVLQWGIVSAIIMRGFFICWGMVAINNMRVILLPIALILIISSIKMAREDDDAEESVDVSNLLVVRIANRIFGSTAEYDGVSFFSRISDDQNSRSPDLLEMNSVQEKTLSTKGGNLRPTPLFLCLLAIEFSDLVFAVDSIPAALSISKDATVVYTSNIFAVALLRSLYVLVNRIMIELPLLRPAIAALLLLVGVKLLVEYFKPDLIGIATTFGGITVILGTGILLSVRKRLQMRGGGTKENSQRNIWMRNGIGVLLLVSLMVFVGAKMDSKYKISSLVALRYSVGRKPYITKDRKPIIYRFDSIDRGEWDESNLSIPYYWYKLWESAGWYPVSLNLERNRGQLNERQVQLLYELGEVDMPDKEKRHIEKYIAMAAVGGGWVAHSDVFPLHPFFNHGLVLPNDGLLTIYDHQVPCLMSGSEEHWLEMAQKLVNYAKTRNIGQQPSWSEVGALRAVSSEMKFAMHQEVYTAPMEDKNLFSKETSIGCEKTKEMRAVHFAFDEIGGNDPDDPSQIVTSWIRMWFKVCENSFYFTSN